MVITVIKMIAIGKKMIAIGEKKMGRDIFKMLDQEEIIEGTGFQKS